MSYSAKTIEEVRILTDTEEILKALLIDTIPISKGGFRKGGNYIAQEYSIKRMIEALKTGRFPDSYEYYLPYYEKEDKITAKDKIDRNFKKLKKTARKYISGKRIYDNYEIQDDYQYCIVITPKNNNDPTKKLTIKWCRNTSINKDYIINDVHIQMLTQSDDSLELVLDNINHSHKHETNNNVIIDTHIVTHTMSLISSFLKFSKSAVIMWTLYVTVPFSIKKRSEHYIIDLAKLLLMSTSIIIASISSLKFIRRMYDFDISIENKLNHFISIEYAIFATLFILAVAGVTYLLSYFLKGHCNFYDVFKHTVIITVTITCFMFIMEMTLGMSKGNINWFILKLTNYSILYVATIINYAMLKKITCLPHLKTFAVYLGMNVALITLKYPLLISYM